MPKLLLAWDGEIIFSNILAHVLMSSIVHFYPLFAFSSEPNIPEQSNWYQIDGLIFLLLKKPRILVILTIIQISHITKP